MNLLDRLDTSAIKFACAVYAVVFDSPVFFDINIAGVLEAVAALHEKEQYVLDERLRHGKVLEAIGADMGLSRERIRQIEANAVRKLRLPKTAAAMRVSSLEHRTEELQAQVEALAEQNAALTKRDRLLRRSVMAALDGAMVVKSTPGAPIPIENLGLNIRAYNCLYRAGHRTTEDVLKLDRKALFRIRNLGRGTLSDIVERMRLEGFTEWAEEVIQNAQ